MNLPWSKLSSESVEIIIEELYVVLTPLDPQAWEVVSTYDELRRLGELDKLIRHYLRKVSNEGKNSSMSKDFATPSPHSKNSEMAEEEKTQNKTESKEHKDGFFGRLRTRVHENTKVLTSRSLIILIFV